MSAARQNAAKIANLLVNYKDSLAKQNLPLLDARELRAILSGTSSDPLLAQQELEMAWRFYNQEREKQIYLGYFRKQSTEDELNTAMWLKGEREFPEVPEGDDGLDRIQMGIELAIITDISIEAAKWKVVEIEEERIRAELGDGSVRLIRNKIEESLRDGSIILLKNHVHYWAKNFDNQNDSRNISEILKVLSLNPEIARLELIRGWCFYTSWRQRELEAGLTPYANCTKEEKEAAKHPRRNCPDQCIKSTPQAMEILENHIKDKITEDIAAEREIWIRNNQEAEDRRRQRRPERIARYRHEFESKVVGTFVQDVLDVISDEDIRFYSEGAADGVARTITLWNAVINKYDFDQKTKSCLYFIRQGDAIKIGITGDINKRFAQIKTSASLPCTIENVVYTHFGKQLERSLHRALQKFNCHLEWFILPPCIETKLFNAKSKRAIEEIILNLE